VEIDDRPDQPDPPNEDAETQIRPAAHNDLDQLLPFMAEYQRHYGNQQPDTERNRRFFSRFLEPSDAGLLLGAWVAEEAAGFACLYWTFTSVNAGETVLLNDLFVETGKRSAGVGRALIDAAKEVARERGALALKWQTELSNRRAQRLYEQMGAERSELFEYEVGLGPPPTP